MLFRCDEFRQVERPAQTREQAALGGAHPLALTRLQVVVTVKVQNAVDNVQSKLAAGRGAIAFGVSHGALNGDDQFARPVVLNARMSVGPRV